MCLITEVEDKRLRECGLVKEVPEKCNSSNKFSRYKFAKIKKPKFVTKKVRDEIVSYEKKRKKKK